MKIIWRDCKKKRRQNSCSKRERIRELRHYQKKIELHYCEMEDFSVYKDSHTNTHTISEQYGFF